MNDIELNPQRASDPVSGPASLGVDTDAAAYRMSARDFLVQFFYHARLTRNCVLLGLVIGVITAVVTPGRYTADTLMLVFVGAELAAVQDASVTGPAVVSIDGLKVVQSEIQIIQTMQVITSAVDRVGPGAIYPALVERRLFGLLPRLDAAAVHGAAIEKFRRDLRVETEPGGNVISISFTHPNRDIAIRCVQAVLDAYLEQRRTIYANTNSSFLDEQVAHAARRMNSARHADPGAARPLRRARHGAGHRPCEQSFRRHRAAPEPGPGATRRRRNGNRRSEGQSRQPAWHGP